MKRMADMETVSEALDRLGAKGYTHDFSVDGAMVRCAHCDAPSDPRDVAVDQVVRFEGVSDPDDQAIVLAVSCMSCSMKGTLTLSYGASMSAGEATVSRLLADGRPSAHRH